MCICWLVVVVLLLLSVFTATLCAKACSVRGNVSVQSTEVGSEGLEYFVLRGLFLYLTRVGNLFLRNVAVCHSTRRIVLHALPLRHHSCGNLNLALGTVPGLADGRE